MYLKPTFSFSVLFFLTFGPLLGLSESPDRPDASDGIPLYFSPVPIGAKLGPLRVVAEKDPLGFKLGGALIESDRFDTDLQDNNLMVAFDPTLVQPQFALVMNEKSEVLKISDYPGPFLRLTKNLSLVEWTAKSDKKAPNGTVEIELDPAIMSAIKGYRVCFTEEEWDGMITACSAPIGEETKSKDSLLVNSVKVLAKGDITLKDSEDLEFLAQFKTGALLKGRYRVNPSTIREAYQANNGDLVVSFFSTPPATPHRLLTKKRSRLLDATIGDLRKVHEVHAPLNLPFVHFKASKGIIFSQRVDYSYLPKEDERMYLDSRSPLTTYRSELKLKGRLNKIKREQLVADPKVKSSSDRFEWTYQATNSNAMNTDSIKLAVPRNDGKETKQIEQYAEVQRSHSSYLSARAGISADTRSALALNGEIVGIHWFEKIAGEDYWLSRQRWGVRGIYNQSVVETKKVSAYQQTLVDVIYRLQPGVENWTETAGFSLGLQQFKIGSTYDWVAPSIGFIWNRSAPPWFDSITAFLPYFRRPKWVNFSAMMFPVSLSSQVIDAYGFQMSALGRVELSKSTFLEGGWAIAGFKYISTNGKEIRDQVTIGIGRGYLGLGVRF